MRFVPGFAVIALTLALAVSLDIADTHDTRTWADARAQILTDDDPRLRLSSADRAAYEAMWGTAQTASPDVAKAVSALDAPYHARRMRRLAEAGALAAAAIVGITLFARQWRKRAPPLKVVAVVLGVVVALGIIAAFIVATLAGSAIHG